MKNSPRYFIEWTKQTAGYFVYTSLHIIGRKLRTYICIYFYINKETLKAISKTNNVFTWAYVW